MPATAPPSDPLRQPMSGPVAGPIFEIRDLRKSYGAKEVLAGLDFQVERGE